MQGWLSTLNFNGSIISIWYNWHLLMTILTMKYKLGCCEVESVDAYVVDLMHNNAS